MYESRAFPTAVPRPASPVEAAFTVVPNVVDTELFVGDGRERNGRLLAVGLLYEAKGYEFLLRAVAELGRSGRDVRLYIGGDGPDRGEYERLMDTAIAEGLPYDTLVRLAESAQSVTGYGPVKEAAVAAWRERVRTWS